MMYNIFFPVFGSPGRLKTGPKLLFRAIFRHQIGLQTNGYVRN